MVVAGRAAENGLRSCNWSATAAGWCRTQCGHHQLSCGAETQRRNAALLPRTGLNNVLLGRQTLACSRELRTGPARAQPAAAAACGCPETGPGSWPRAAAPRPLHSRDTRPASSACCSAALLSRALVSSHHPVTSSRAGLGWGWGWMLKITKNKMLHFFADVHCTSKHTAACPPAPGRHTFVYMEAIRAECPD